MMSMRFRALSIGVLLSLAATLPCAKPACAADSYFAGHHRELQFAFTHTGQVISQRDWPEVTSPHKFSQEIVIEQQGARVIIMVFDLADRSGDWWLAEVMGFLLDPQLDIASSLSASGYEYYDIAMPGGRGVYEQTEVLLVAPGAGYRFTCYRCKDAGALPSFYSLVDSFEQFTDLPFTTEAPSP